LKNQQDRGKKLKFIFGEGVENTNFLVRLGTKLIKFKQCRKFGKTERTVCAFVFGQQKRFPLWLVVLKQFDRPVVIGSVQAL